MSVQCEQPENQCMHMQSSTAMFFFLDKEIKDSSSGGWMIDVANWSRSTMYYCSYWNRTGNNNKLGNWKSSTYGPLKTSKNQIAQ